MCASCRCALVQSFLCLWLSSTLHAVKVSACSDLLPTDSCRAHSLTSAPAHLTGINRAVWGGRGVWFWGGDWMNGPSFELQEDAGGWWSAVWKLRGKKAWQQSMERLNERLKYGSLCRAGGNPLGCCCCRLSFTSIKGAARSICPHFLSSAEDKVCRWFLIKSCKQMWFIQAFNSLSNYWGISSWLWQPKWSCWILQTCCFDDSACAPLSPETRAQWAKLHKIRCCRSIYVAGHLPVVLKGQENYICCNRVI